PPNDPPRQGIILRPGGATARVPRLLAGGRGLSISDPRPGVLRPGKRRPFVCSTDAALRRNGVTSTPAEQALKRSYGIESLVVKSRERLGDQQLIERYIDPGGARYPGGRADARLKDYGVSVWALVG